jgi:predicted O-methyltransferase YrrM
MPLRIRQATFPIFQRLGFHVTSNHFNQPIPDTRTLKESLWTRHSELVGIDLNERKQRELLGLFVQRFKAEYDRFPLAKGDSPSAYYVNNKIFESVDGEMLYCMVRYLKPRRIIEVGSGFSTLLFAQAIARNKQEDVAYECELIAIEPYPNRVLKTGIPGLSRLIEDEVQNVPLALFASLGENDILFIDSSHVVRIGSDVQYECLEVLPRLAKGVVVHFHDIFFPAEYPRDIILKGYQFPNEQYIVQAFLAFNGSFELVWAGSFMHLAHPKQLEDAFASYTRAGRWPGSLWLRRVDPAVHLPQAN